jgi:hypothetical protein
MNLGLPLQGLKAVPVLATGCPNAGIRGQRRTPVLLAFPLAMLK